MVDHPTDLGHLKGARANTRRRSEAYIQYGAVVSIGMTFYDRAVRFEYTVNETHVIK